MRVFFSFLFLAPFAFLHFLGIKLHQAIYKWKFFPVFHAPFPICSIGNLTVGGTGKTPFLHWLISYLKERKKEVWVVGHGYGGKARKVTQVNLKEERQKLYRQHGDESTWLALKNPEIPVYTGPSKYKVMKILAKKMEAMESIEIKKRKDGEAKEKPWVLLDDGFQHWPLARTKDIVLLDATLPLSAYMPFPLGRARGEGWSGIKRAHLLVITRANFVSPKKIQKILKRIPKGIPCTALAYELKSFLHLSSGKRLEKNALQGQCFWSLSAIGNPSSFHWILKERAKINLKKSFSLRDHYPHLFKKLSKLQNQLSKSKSKASQPIKGIVITEKDAVKVWSQKENFSQVWVAEMEMLPYHELKGLPSIYDILKDCF